MNRSGSTLPRPFAAGLRPRDSFLFAHTTDADHDAFNHLISWVAISGNPADDCGSMGRTPLARPQPRALVFAGGLGRGMCAAYVARSRIRCGISCPSCVSCSFPGAGCCAWAFRSRLLTTAGSAAMEHRAWRSTWRCCACSLSCGTTLQPPWWDNAADLREMQDNMATGAGYEGTDEYTPVGADPSYVDKDARRVTVDGPAHAAIHVSRLERRNANSSRRRCQLRTILLCICLTIRRGAWR